MKNPILPTAVASLALAGCPSPKSTTDAGSRPQSEVVADFERQVTVLVRDSILPWGYCIPDADYRPCVASAADVAKAELFVPRPYRMLKSGASEEFSKRIYRIGRERRPCGVRRHGRREVGAKLDPFEKLRVCGGEYLWQVDLGACLWTGIEFTFRSIEDKSRLKAKETVELVNVVFIQEGGDRHRTNEIAEISMSWSPK